MLLFASMKGIYSLPFTLYTLLFILYSLPPIILRKVLVFKSLRIFPRHTHTPQFLQGGSRLYRQENP